MHEDAITDEEREHLPPEFQEAADWSEVPRALKGRAQRRAGTGEGGEIADDERVHLPPEYQEATDWTEVPRGLRRRAERRVRLHAGRK